MAAILLSDGRVQRPYQYRESLPVIDGGSGNYPAWVVVEWSDKTSYDGDVLAGNINNGSFAGVEVPGFDPCNSGSASAARSALLGLGGDYDGATTI